MNKLISGIVAILIYLGLVFSILIALNRHNSSKNYVEKNENRVTVSLVNSDRVIFNNKSQKNLSHKVDIKPPSNSSIKHAMAPLPALPKKSKPKKIDKLPKDYLIKKRREQERLARIKRERERKRLEELKKKKEAERLARVKRERERKRLEELKKKKEAERLARVKREREQRRRERARSLFSSIPNQTIHSSRVDRDRKMRVKHNLNVLDRIKNTHLSGRVSNKNRERGVVNGYIARVKRQLSNWNAQSEFKGHSATIRLIIYSNGHFKYIVKNSTSGALTAGLKRFLKQLNRIGLGEHTKSSPYIIEVTFRAK